MRHRRKRRRRQMLNGVTAEEYADKILNQLFRDGLIICHRHGTKEEDERGIDFIVETDDGQCFIDVKSYRLKHLFHDAATSQRFFSEKHNGLFILYYRPCAKNEIAAEADLLFQAIKAHREKLNKILFFKYTGVS